MIPIVRSWRDTIRLRTDTSGSEYMKRLTNYPLKVFHNTTHPKAIAITPSIASNLNIQCIKPLV